MTLPRNGNSLGRLLSFVVFAAHHCGLHSHPLPGAQPASFTYFQSGKRRSP